MAEPKLAQDDFDLLHISDTQSLSEQRMCESNPLQSFICRESSFADEKYTPVNFIPESVHDLIRSWKVSNLIRQEALESTDDAMSVEGAAASNSDDVYEPLRFLTESTPPKKFYRTFWRSAARRALQREKEMVTQIRKAEPV